MTEISQDYLNWLRQDQILLCWIKSSLSENVHAQIIGLKTSAEVWNALKHSYAAHSRSRVMQLKSQLQDLKKGNMSMDAYFQKVRVIAHQLAIASKPIDEDDLVLYILRGLPVEYLAFKISMETRKEPVSLNELYGLLLMQEANQKSHDDDFLPTVNNVFKEHNERPHTYHGRGRLSKTYKLQPIRP
ncbi:hypothetical protein EJ110_NYTH37991 [Nymphaea thermarum]|nr:hypothetical protein EJ110_NYTH37991 [Nymphaea thermarum]